MHVENMTPQEMFQINTAAIASLSRNTLTKGTVEKATIEARASGFACCIGTTTVNVAAICDSLSETVQFAITCAEPTLYAYQFSEAKTVVVTKTLEQRFREQADKWARETQHLSSPTQKMMHSSYQAILGMALEHKREIIRLLILDLKQHRNEWFWALSYLTQENPIKPADAGKMDRMIAAWVNWGRAEHII